MSVVHYYDMPQAVYLTTGLGGNLVNYPVSRSDVYMAKGVTNEIMFYIKDIDNKPVSMTDSVLMRISDRSTGIVLLTVTLTLSDPTVARYFATVPPQAIAAIDTGLYVYAMTRVATDGTERLLYADRSRTEFGIVEVRDGPIPPNVAAMEVPVSAFLPLGNVLYSGSFPGPLQVGSMDGMITAALYSTAFTGTVTIQGSLEPSPSTDDQDWFPLASASLSAFTGTSPLTTIAAVTFIRFKVEVVDVSNPNFSKLTFRA